MLLAYANVRRFLINEKERIRKNLKFMHFQYSQK